MKHRAGAFVALIAAGLSSLALAGEGYKCEMKQALQRTDDGKMLENGLSKTMVNMNKEFVVDRKTGRIIGGSGISNFNEGFGSPKILDPGSSEQAFKVLTVFHPNVSIAYLEIIEYAKGEVKPFTLIISGSVFSGICRHH